MREMNRRPFYRMSIDRLQIDDGIKRDFGRMGCTTVGDVMDFAERGNDAMISINPGTGYLYTDETKAYLLQCLRKQGYLPDHHYDVPIELLELRLEAKNWLLRVGIATVGDVLDFMERVESGGFIGSFRGPKGISMEDMLDNIRHSLSHSAYLTYDMARDELREWFAVRYPGGVDDLKRELVAQGHLPPEAL
ncbi:MAG: hypothetical protein AAFR56_18750 [Chloroflexota bacterium]